MSALAIVRAYRAAQQRARRQKAAESGLCTRCCVRRATVGAHCRGCYTRLRTLKRQRKEPAK